MVQNVLRVSIAIDDAFPSRCAFKKLIKEVFVEKAESIMRTKSKNLCCLLSLTGQRSPTFLELNMQKLPDLSPGIMELVSNFICACLSRGNGITISS